MRAAWKTARVLVAALAGAGCAEGTPEEQLVLGSGQYDLATQGFEGDCLLDGAITPGAEHVGKVFQVLLTVGETAVTIEACDPFFDDCFATVGEPLSLLVDDQELLADEPSWLYAGCGCLTEYRGSRSVQGTILHENSADLTWTFDLPGPPADCACTEHACHATVEQTLTRR